MPRSLESLKSLGRTCLRRLREHRRRRRTDLRSVVAGEGATDSVQTTDRLSPLPTFRASNSAAPPAAPQRTDAIDPCLAKTPNAVEGTTPGANRFYVEEVTQLNETGNDATPSLESVPQLSGVSSLAMNESTMTSSVFMTPTATPAVSSNSRLPASRLANESTEFDRDIERPRDTVCDQSSVLERAASHFWRLDSVAKPDFILLQTEPDNEAMSFDKPANVSHIEQTEPTIAALSSMYSVTSTANGLTEEPFKLSMEVLLDSVTGATASAAVSDRGGRGGRGGSHRPEIPVRERARNKTALLRISAGAGDTLPIDSIEILDVAANGQAVNYAVYSIHPDLQSPGTAGMIAMLDLGDLHSPRPTKRIVTRRGSIDISLDVMVHFGGTLHGHVTFKKTLSLPGDTSVEPSLLARAKRWIAFPWKSCPQVTRECIKAVVLGPLRLIRSLPRPCRCRDATGIQPES